jgi:hypothetical protein
MVSRTLLNLDVCTNVLIDDKAFHTFSEFQTALGLIRFKMGNCPAILHEAFQNGK